MLGTSIELAAGFRPFVAGRLGALQESDALLLGQSLTAAQECLAPWAQPVDLFCRCRGDLIIMTRTRDGPPSRLKPNRW